MMSACGATPRPEPFPRSFDKLRMRGARRGFRASAARELINRKRHHPAFFVANLARRAIISSTNAWGSNEVPRPALASPSDSASEAIISALGFRQNRDLFRRQDGNERGLRRSAICPRHQTILARGGGVCDLRPSLSENLSHSVVGGNCAIRISERIAIALRLLVA